MPIVTGTCTAPDGRPVYPATITIRLITAATDQPGYTTTGDIIGSTQISTDPTGTWTATLVANTLITPANSYYQVNERGFVSDIVVPDGPGPYQLGAILATPPPTPAAPGITGLTIAANGTIAGVRPQLNLIAGNGALVAAADNAAAGRVDVTLSAADVLDVAVANQAYRLTSNGADVINLNTSAGRLEHLGGLLSRWYSGAYSGASVEIDGAIGHINLPGTAAPVPVLVPAAIGAAIDGASVTVNGNDHRGQIAVTTASSGLGSFPATVANFTFHSAWANPPQLTITAADAGSAARALFANAYSTTQFLLGFATAPAPSTTYYVNYQVLG